MFDMSSQVTAEGIDALVSVLAGADGASTAPEAVDLLAALERVKAAAAAAQARVTAAFVGLEEGRAEALREQARGCAAVGDFDGWVTARDAARAASVEDDVVRADPGARTAVGRRRRTRPSRQSGVAAQVALARRESPVHGARHVRLALTLTREMPHALAALEEGLLSEWRAEILVRETAVLTGAHRRLVDAELLGGPRSAADVLDGVGDRELARRVQEVAYRVDPASVVARASRAEAERRVTLRPAPDTMAYLTALLPVAQAVAAHAALTVAADTARASGDDRGKGQVMADTLVTRLTGQACATAVPVEVQLVMTDRTLLAGDATPAQVPGYGTVPAEWARTLLTPDHGPSDESAAAAVWLRRLYTHPGTGTLVAMDSHRRTFDGGLRRYLLARDAATCRTPWCDAPARHLDHVVDHADGGATTESNGQSLCVRCNHTKQLPGFVAATTSGHDAGVGAPHTVVTTTPTGHTYSSQAPTLVPGLPPPRAPDVSSLSPLERVLALALAA